MNSMEKKVVFALCLALCAAPVASSGAATFEKIFRFPAGGKDGRKPEGKLTLGPDGNFYGTTSAGGAHYAGTVFKVTPLGQLTTLYTFSGAPDGDEPSGTVVFDAAGNLYGTTQFGGPFEGGSNYGGTVYKLAPDGTETILHSFGADGDGNYVPAGLTYDGNGTFYGVTAFGGAGSGTGVGTIFSLSTSGTETLLYSFDTADGAEPLAPLFLDKDGALLGTTFFGGKYGYGTVFRLATTGKLKLLHSFGENKTDPQGPRSPLVLGQNGEFYGTTEYGGTQNYGTAYAISRRDGTEKVIISFGGSAGIYPRELIVDSRDVLYGTADDGGRHGEGVAFALNPTGKVTVLHSFNGRDGYAPIGVTFDSSGNLYGITNELTGFEKNDGIVFKIVP